MPPPPPGAHAIPSGNQETDDQMRAYDPMTIAARATTDYGELFTDPGDDTEVRELILCRSQGWYNDGVVITQEDARPSFYSMARGKTTGADRIPAEAWHMGVDRDDRICITVAWAFNRGSFDIAPPATDSDYLQAAMAMTPTDSPADIHIEADRTRATSANDKRDTADDAPDTLRDATGTRQAPRRLRLEPTTWEGHRRREQPQRQ